METFNKYVCVVKITKTRFCRWHVINLINFTKFLDRDYPGWLYFNVYNQYDHRQITSFTKNHRPEFEKVNQYYLKSK